MTAPAEPSDGAPTGFAELGLAEPIVAALAALGYEEPTPIQREAIPPLLAGRDLLGQAATGTGKTAAFALPLLQRGTEGVASDRDTVAPTAAGSGGPFGLVLVPTRELAMQVAEAVHKYGRGLGVRVLPVYGGAPMGPQLRALERGVHVVIATPGRALDHVRRESLRLDEVRVLVLDEADEMLDMGFADDLEAILSATPEGRQTALFSATMAPRITAIAARHLRDPVEVRIARESVVPGTAPRVRQVAYIVPRAHKLAALGRVLDMEVPTSALVFCRTRTEVDELTESLNGRGYRAEALHGGLSQEQRDRVMKKFRAGTADLLVATDVAARGLDVEHLSHVVNYDVPSAPDAYVHRIGRTGRAGREGVAITLAEPREHRLLRNIEHATKQRIAIATVPTVADLRARRLELLRASLRETLLAAAEADDDGAWGGGRGGERLDGFRVVVETLAEEFDPMDVAAAAVRLAHEAGGATAEGDEVEIPAWVPRERGTGRGGEGRERERPRFGHRERGAPPDESVPRARRAPATDSSHPGPRDRPARRPAFDVARVYVGAGRHAGIRPGDLVGAIANEAGLDAGDIGAIEIADRFSLVEVPRELADDVIDALRGTTIRGKRVVVRRDRGR